MRALLLVPIALLVTGACGFAVCRLFGWDVHRTELLTAAATCLVAGYLAAAPLLLVRGGERSVRLLPPLDVRSEDIEEAVRILDQTLTRLEAEGKSS